MKRFVYAQRTITSWHIRTVRPAPSTIHSRAMSTEKTPKEQPETTSMDPNLSDQQASSQPLPLPEPPKDTDATTLDVSTGQSVKLDKLGPMVVNRDGTLSRIANWEHMTEIERNNTLRVLGKRNQVRLGALRNDEANGEESGGK
ncbi:uncharacterized protein EI97DRAFT_429432 [Westerdykella ornata]|uniref:Uncharacterized protein n=1 Tax=Westerdykella ornata TaxID=318751 RepID=A0A6A6JYV2_WESOR|nr:uncharacterized protein EI97DRAFT_429432 [Westerdykella ornata]KAF2281385.1 hypothetical protein EI97DRAFT_429432 [Westerdykella ornata]